ncbi:DHS-like NAD/FAD-binding domain-containing protein [Abortiporus biennis]|nr:DHS-like NAD/FAD-binding domain-containing protein [Abortiporus biennis]
MAPSDDAEEFRQALKRSQHIIVIAGAGLSAASGIPTFRGAGGMWRSLDATNLATPEAFKEDPSLVWQFYHHRRVKALEAQPNPAHFLLAHLSIPSFLRKVAPAAKTFNLITQNVDRLSIRAAETIATEQASQLHLKKIDRIKTNNIIEMHGRLFDVKCTSCDHSYEDLSNPLCPALGAADEQFANYHDAGSKDIDISETELPRCPKCGALARPGVVWFGEKPLMLDEINQLVFKADMCLVIGTSSTVHPAAGYAYRVKRRGGTVAVFNLEPSEGDEKADFVFCGPCEVELPRALGISGVETAEDKQNSGNVEIVR